MIAGYSGDPCEELPLVPAHVKLEEQSSYHTHRQRDRSDGLAPADAVTPRSRARVHRTNSTAMDSHPSLRRYTGNHSTGAPMIYFGEEAAGRRTR